MYVNDLINVIEELNCGVNLGDIPISILAILIFADDVLFIYENPDGVQTMLKALSVWCRQWHMCVNIETSQIMHFRADCILHTYRKQIDCSG